MAKYRLKISCVAAAFALAGCGETASEPAASNAAAAAGGVTIELPEAKAPPAPPPPLEYEAEAEAKEEASVAKAAPEAKKAEAAKPEASKPEAPKPEAPKPEATPAEASPKADDPPARADQTPLPLSNAVVARTIERIGYACGAVASSVRIDAPAGERAYRITCTSGETYRASDSSGRFRFRKLSGSR